MLLYDIFYTDGSMDSSRPLPNIPREKERAEYVRRILKGARAVCVNGEPETLAWDSRRCVWA